MFQVSLDARERDPLALISHPLLVVILVLLFNELDVLSNLICCLNTLTDLEVEIAEIERA